MFIISCPIIAIIVIVGIAIAPITSNFLIVL